MKKQIKNHRPHEPTLSRYFWIGAQVSYDAKHWKELRESSGKSKQ